MLSSSSQRGNFTLTTSPLPPPLTSNVACFNFGMWGSCAGDNQPCQISTWSVPGFGDPGGRKSLSPIDWMYHPYNSVHTNVLRCDISRGTNVCLWLVTVERSTAGVWPTGSIRSCHETNAPHANCFPPGGTTTQPTTVHSRVWSYVFVIVTQFGFRLWHIKHFSRRRWFFLFLWFVVRRLLGFLA